MYEVVAIIKGYSIMRMIGSRKVYWVILSETKNFKKQVRFRTIKEAAQFIETL